MTARQMATDAADKATAAAQAATAAQSTASQVAQAAAPAIGAGARDRAELRAMIGALQTEIGELAQQVTVLQGQLVDARTTPAPPGPSDGQVAAAVAQYLTANPPPPGKSVELRTAGDAVQWRPVGGTWANLVALSAITGPPGTPADMARVSAVETAVAALRQPAGKLSAGQAPVPAIAAGATGTVQVTLTPPQPDIGFTAAAFVVGGTNIMTLLSVQSWSVVSATRVDVTVRAAGTLTAGAAQVLVVAHRP